MCPAWPQFTYKKDPRTLSVDRVILNPSHVCLIITGDVPSMATVHIHKGPSPPPELPQEDDDVMGLLVNRPTPFQVCFVFVFVLCVERKHMRWRLCPDLNVMNAGRISHHAS